MVQETVKAIVQQMTANGDTFEFLHSESEWQNIEGDDATLPVVYLDMPVKSALTIESSGHFKREFICVALFLYKSKLDDNPDEQYDALKLAMAAERNFILLMDKELNNTVKSYSLGEDYQVQNMFDVNLSGIVLPFRIEPINFDSVCV